MMKKISLIFFLLTGTIGLTQCCGNYFNNGNFETGTPAIPAGATRISNNIYLADHWSKIWDNFSSGEFLNASVNPASLLDPVPATGNYGGFWVANSSGGIREGIMNELADPIPNSSGSYDLNFELAVVGGSDDINAEMGVYGVYNPGTLSLASSDAALPTNLNLFGASNTVLLGTITVNGSVDGAKQSIFVNFNSGAGGFPPSGITHIFLTRTALINGAQKFVAVDNFCLKKSLPREASMFVGSEEIVTIETGCGSLEVAELCEGNVIIESTHCAVSQYMLSVWEWNPADCSYGDLVYTTSPTSGTVPSTFDLWSLPGFTPEAGTVYWIEWGIQHTNCEEWDFDYAAFQVSEDCCEPGIELEASINNDIIGYDPVYSATYGWTIEVPIVCAEDGIYNFLTNIPCSDVYTIRNSTFNTDTWVDETTLYSDAGSELSGSITLNAGEYELNEVNHLQVAIASPYQVVDILWIPGCELGGCEGNYMANGNFEGAGTPSGLSDDIDNAESWMSIWNPAYGTGEFSAFDTFYPSLLSPTPPSGNYGGFWVSNYTGGEREGIMNELAIPIPYGTDAFDLNFDIAVSRGTENAEIGVYGVYNPSSSQSDLVTSVTSHSPANLALFGPGNVVLLGTIPVTGPDNGYRQNVNMSFCANMAGFPTDGITHIFFTRSELINGGKKFVGLDNFCLQKREVCSASMDLTLAETTILESECGSFRVPMLCDGQILINDSNCPIEQYMLSIWEYSIADCERDVLVYTNSVAATSAPSSFDLWGLPGFTPVNGKVYFIEWAVQSSCDNWTFDYELFMAREDCCIDDIELDAWINDPIVGYQTVTSATYGWSYEVPFLCDPIRIYDFLTNVPCADVYTIKNSTFNTNTWVDLTTHYSVSGSGTVPGSISLSPGQYAAGVVNHLQVAVASPYQVVDILWVPGCDPEIELPTYEGGGDRSAEFTGVGEMTNSDFVLFPSPTNDNVTLRFENNQTGRLSIRSMEGKELINQEFANQIEIPVNLNDLSSGIYMVSVHINGKVINQRLIKN